jgi:hypothetical protein
MLAGVWVIFVAVCLGEEPLEEPGKPRGPEEALRAFVEAKESADAAPFFDLLSARCRKAFASLHALARKPGETQKNLLQVLEATPEQIDVMEEREFAIRVLRGCGFRPPDSSPPSGKPEITILETTELGEDKREIRFRVGAGGEQSAVLVREGEDWRYDTELLTCAELETLVSKAIAESPAARSLTEKKNVIICQNNLRQIGALLSTMQAGAGFKRYSGPAFILQLVEQLSDEDLDIFLCPGEPENPAFPRPKPGTREFVKMYRSLELPTEANLSRYTSYAGPDWKNHPADLLHPANRLWACDRCRDGKLHHAGGIAVLYADSGRVELLEPEGLPADRKLLLGPESLIPLLQKMTF